MKCGTETSRPIRQMKSPVMVCTIIYLHTPSCIKKYSMVCYCVVLYYIVLVFCLCNYLQTKVKFNFNIQYVLER